MSVSHPIAAALVASLFASISLAGVAAAIEGEPTRAEYVAELEEICEPRVNATQKAVKGIRGDLRAERLKVAATKFGRAERIFGATLDEISVVPRPPADRLKLAKWFGYLGEQETYLGKIAAALRAGRSVQSQRFTSRFLHNGNLANNVVLAFGFDHCSFKFGRFR